MGQPLVGEQLLQVGRAEALASPHVDEHLREAGLLALGALWIGAPGGRLALDSVAGQRGGVVAASGWDSASTGCRSSSGSTGGCSSCRTRPARDACCAPAPRPRASCGAARASGARRRVRTIRRHIAASGARVAEQGSRRHGGSARGTGRRRIPRAPRLGGGHRRVVAPGPQVIAQEPRNDASASSWVSRRRASERSSGCRRPCRRRRRRRAAGAGPSRRGSSSSPARGQLLLDRPNLVRQAKEVQVADVLRSDERDRGSRSPRAPGPPRPVHVLVGGLGEVVVDDVRQVRDVNPARGHVGRHEEAQPTLSRGAHHALPVVLGQIAVQPVGVEASRLERLGHALGLVARVAEHDGALGILHLEDAHELADLVAARAARRRSG